HASSLRDDHPLPSQTSALPLHDALPISGRRVYNNHCYFCHGYSGDGRTLASRYLDPPPRDFSSLRPGELGREAMIAAVTDGRPGDRKSTRLNSSHVKTSYAVFCWKKKNE